MVFSFDEILKESYEFAKETYSNSDIYFYGHIVPVARECGNYAEILGANVFISNMGGLFHDIGYTSKYEFDSKDHIVKGMIVTRKFLDKTELGINDKDRIIDCIRTHDGYLEENSPLENIIVNDVDSIMFFDQIPVMMRLKERLGQNINSKKYWEDIKKHGDETLLNVSDYYLFSKLAEERYKVFLDNLAFLRKQYESK